METVVANSKIHKRGLTSFFTLFGFLIMSVTGLVLYVVPEGRVAYWTTWELIGLTKTDWGNIHILSSILFIVAGAFHIYFNWRPLMNYFKSRARQGVRLGRELAIASVFSAIIVIGAIWPFPPLSYLLDFNDWIKTTWIVEDDYEPPFGHAELLSLKTFADKMDIDLNQAIEELRANGIRFESAEQTLEEISEANGISPMSLYLLIKKFEPSPEPEKLTSFTSESIELAFAGTGVGNQSVVSVCARLGLDEGVAMGRLSRAGLGEDISRTLKVIAEEADSDPITIMKVLLLDSYRLEPDTAS
jgi:hypothetical protein